ncbi:hypothetical protein DPEC_G00244500 [Dallia pectoralis]|uniref:Uncharacterized protein n=1 Tax=Dallia pectoralis TaxID=75939 RepID=A0ACC2FVV0_DALPE|nr:hypothetical protein DPEC_G00244500 [Dallia pectoralis]
MLTSANQQCTQYAHVFASDKHIKLSLELIQTEDSLTSVRTLLAMLLSLWAGCSPSYPGLPTPDHHRHTLGKQKPLHRSSNVCTSTKCRYVRNCFLGRRRREIDPV